MDNTATEYNTVDEYILLFPDNVQSKLREIRETIRAAAPDAQEKISYKMPAYMLNGRPLAYFAAFKSHIGFYPLPVSIEEFREELKHYKTAKGSVQFPLDEPLPLDLIARMVGRRAEDNRNKSK